jgi:YggT family protein
MIISIINLVFNILYVLIFARIIFSFIQVSPYHPTWGPIQRTVYELTEPIMAPFRRLIPPMGGLDFSPILLFILIGFLRRLLISMFI